MNRGIAWRYRFWEAAVSMGVIVYCAVASSLGHRCPDCRRWPCKCRSEVLAAFRSVTGWSDALALHHADAGGQCGCMFICGHTEGECPLTDEIVRT